MSATKFSTEPRDSSQVTRRLIVKDTNADERYAVVETSFSTPKVGSICVVSYSMAEIHRRLCLGGIAEGILFKHVRRPFKLELFL